MRFVIPALLAATVLTTGCANSVANDPAHMARVRAEEAARTERWNRAWSSGTSVGGGYSTSGASSGTQAGGTQAGGVPRCYQTSASRQTCFR